MCGKGVDMLYNDEFNSLESFREGCLTQLHLFKRFSLYFVPLAPLILSKTHQADDGL